MTSHSCANVDAPEQGCGADVNVEDGNAMLMLKLQVFQNDDEEMIKLVRISLVRGNSELMVSDDVVFM